MKNTLNRAHTRGRRSAFLTLLTVALLFTPFYLVTINSHVSLASSNAVASSVPPSLPLTYTFNSPGTLNEASSIDTSTSPYFWLARGAYLIIQNGVGQTVQGALPVSDPERILYAKSSAVSTDNGTHPQNVFLLFARTPAQNSSAQVYLKHTADNLSNAANRQPYNGEMLLARYKDVNNYYYGGVRADGGVVIKKKTNGVFQTLASKQLIAGTYNATTNPDLIPLGSWIGLKLVVTDTSSGPKLSLYTDIGKTGVWQLAITATDTAVYGSPISGAGLSGIESDYADTQLGTFVLSDPTASTASVTPPAPPTASSTTPVPTTLSYDATILADKPVAYLTMGSPATGSEHDQTGNGNNGTYKGGTPSSATLPNGDTVADFNGSSQYLTVPSATSLSIPTTGMLTYEAWIRPDTLQFPNVANSDGYVDWMGKCENYSPTCEWEARMYSSVTTENRPDRLSGYVFNGSAGLGSAADWQPSSGVITAGKWLHVVVEYQTKTTPAGCSSAYPGSINIWVNGVEQSFASHAPTGCMSQYSVTPKASNSPVDIGTMAFDSWFKGAIGKVAIYNTLLSQTQINSHFKAMTGGTVSGSCGATCTIP